jgi:DNA-binding response OmpR family regulator
MIKLLIVDDEVDFLEMLTNRLKKRKIDVEGVTSGEDALKRMEEKVFDVVVLDIKMPQGMDGIEVLRRIKEKWPLIEVILLTGHASVETSIEGLHLGAFDYLMKPASLNELLDKVGAAYERRTSQMQKIQKAKVQEIIRHPGRVFDDEEE